MNSINQQQSGQHSENLVGSEAIDKIRELALHAETCFFCTAIKSGSPFETRPMTIQQVDEEGNLWFLSASDSHLNLQIKNEPKVQLLFQGSKRSDFLTIYGMATIHRDKNRIKEYWQPLLKTWFTEGEDDPRITVIKVEMESGYYWDNKHGNAVALFKMVVGAVLGKTMDDSIEGSLLT